MALIVTQWVYILLVNGDWMTGYRFWAVVVLPICLVIAGLIELLQEFLPVRSRAVVRWTLALLVAGLWFARGQAHYRSEGQQPFEFYAMLGHFTPKHLCPYWATADWRACPGNATGWVSSSPGIPPNPAYSTFSPENRT